MSEPIQTQAGLGLPQGAMIETVRRTAKLVHSRHSSEMGTVADPDSKTRALPSRFLGRQPILKANLKLYGYELLHREGPENCFSGDPEEATRQVIANFLFLVPESGHGKGFVNFTRETLLSGLATMLPPDSTVLEILETIEPDPEVLASCRALRKQGYRFALDDFAPSESRLPFLEFADYIKIDFRASSVAERREIYSLAAPRRSILLAEKIETAEEMEVAKGEGCKLFQGYFFARPSITSHQVIPNSEFVCFRLLAALSEEPTDICKIESLVMLDTSLCYRLLRLVNSVLYGLNSRVTSIRNALVIVGDDEFRKLVTISLAGVFAVPRSNTLVSMALERARFCEMLAPVIGEPGPKLYLMGMLSLIDAILKVPMPQIIESLPLEADMKAALTGKPSKCGTALDLIRAYQAGDWDACDVFQKKLGIGEWSTSRLYVDAVRWADVVYRQ